MNTEIPIASLNQYAYCAHRCWRMFCTGEFVDNQYTIEGTTIHDRVHSIGENMLGETLQIRAIWLRSEKYNLIGKSDLVEVKNGLYIPVEYKRGDRGEFFNDALQVCAQALCLEEMTGKSVKQGYVYYAQTHQREEVIISDELRQSTIKIIEIVGDLLKSGIMPPAIYTPRCKGCSLYDQCLPKASVKIKKYREE